MNTNLMRALLGRLYNLGRDKDWLPSEALRALDNLIGFEWLRGAIHLPPMDTATYAQERLRGIGYYLGIAERKAGLQPRPLGHEEFDREYLRGFQG